MLGRLSLFPSSTWRGFCWQIGASLRLLTKLMVEHLHLEKECHSGFVHLTKHYCYRPEAKQRIQYIPANGHPYRFLAPPLRPSYLSYILGAGCGNSNKSHNHLLNIHWLMESMNAWLVNHQLVGHCCGQSLKMEEAREVRGHFCLAWDMNISSYLLRGLGDFSLKVIFSVTK